MHPGIDISHECNCGITHLELPGQYCLGVSGHVHQGESLPGEPFTFRAGREAGTLDHHHRGTVDHPGQIGGRGPQGRAVGIGEADVYPAGIKVGVHPTTGPVDELIGHDDRAGPEFGGQTAHRTGSEHPAHAECPQCPHIGAVRNGVRRILVAETVARQKGHLM